MTSKTNCGNRAAILGGRAEDVFSIQYSVFSSQWKEEAISGRVLKLNDK
jgi:hypothetical protein